MLIYLKCIGCPGAGKSTFARSLAYKTGLPLYYLDMLWHKPDKTTVSREEFDAALQAIVKQDRWIIDGNYGRTLDVRLRECDAVFLLDFPVEVCLEGAASRIGHKREDMPWIEEDFDPEFKNFIMDFPSNKLPHIYERLETYKDTVYIRVFTSRSEVEEYLQTGR